MSKSGQHAKNSHKIIPKIKPNEQIHVLAIKDDHALTHNTSTQILKIKSKEKSANKTKSKTRQKDSQTDSNGDHSRNQTEGTRKPNLFIQSRKRLTASQDKFQKREKQFKRKNNKNERHPRSTSKKESKKSTDNQNEETLIERLRAENQYYRHAFLTSKESLERVNRILQEEKQRRTNQKEWYKYQINNLKRKLSTDKIRLGHIFTFQSYKNEQVSNMIVETQNQGSSMMNPALAAAQMAQDIADALSDLSIESK